MLFLANATFNFIIVVIIVIVVVLFFSWLNYMEIKADNRSSNSLSRPDPKEQKFIQELKSLGFNSKEELINYFKEQLKPVKQSFNDLVLKCKTETFSQTNIKIHNIKNSIKDLQRDFISYVENNYLSLIKSVLQRLPLTISLLQDDIKHLIDKKISAENNLKLAQKNGFTSFEEYQADCQRKNEHVGKEQENKIGNIKTLFIPDYCTSQAEEACINEFMKEGYKIITHHPSKRGITYIMQKIKY